MIFLEHESHESGESGESSYINAMIRSLRTEIGNRKSENRFIAHRKHRISLIYFRFLWLIFNGITQMGLDDSIVCHPETGVFTTVLLESNWEYRKTLIVYRLTRIECKVGIDGKERGTMN